MNKTDIKLLIGIFLIASLFLFLFTITKDKSLKQAMVYHDGNLVLMIDLSLAGTNYYEVVGDLGPVKLVTKDGQIKVSEETSPFHLCSKQGYIKESYESIICLPNKIVVEISGRREIDVVI